MSNIAISDELLKALEVIAERQGRTVEEIAESSIKSFIGSQLMAAELKSFTKQRPISAHRPGGGSTGTTF